ncbi:helix-turn-helix transcriptional regulator [Flagellimonas pacifica]|nr:WYL domain-containing protein [Allomuricauda parva]
MSRLARLTSILLKLQSKPFVSVNDLAEQFEVSKRTIYRDLDSLEQSGTPIIPIAGKGYSLMEGYNIPPVMFTESEANAILFGQKIIAKTKDESLVNEFNKATDKIKSVLLNIQKEKTDFLANRTIIGKNLKEERTSNYLSEIQKALTNFQLLKIEYKKKDTKTTTSREIEPFAIYYNPSENWILIAWCRLRKDYRNFRIDRIQKLSNEWQQFTPHEMPLEEYVEIQKKKIF